MESSVEEEGPGHPAAGAAQYRVFEGDGGGCRAEFDRKALESIRFECSRAMNGAGGLGIGGVLLGTQAGAAYRVFGWRPIPCDHSRGPAFLLSQRDVAGLASFLDGARIEAAMREWKIVGWFVSHPKGELSLNAEELELQARFFPSDGMAMVVHPDRMGDAECAVVLASGQSAGLGFHVEPLPIQKKDAGEKRARSQAAPMMAGVPDEPGVADPARLARLKRRVARGALAAALLAAAGAGAWMWRRPAPAPAPAEAMPPLPPVELLSLHAGPRGGRFVIEWNGQAPAIRFSSAASLIIVDGERRSEVRLSRQDAVAGLQFFRPESGRVKVTLRLEGAKGEWFEEETEYSAEARPEAQAAPLEGGVIAAGAPASGPEAGVKAEAAKQTPVPKGKPAKKKKKRGGRKQ